MGYRYRLGKVEKSVKDLYQDLEFDQVISLSNVDNEPDFCFSSIPEHTELLTISYPEGFPKTELSNFFDCFDVKKESESDFYIMTKQGLKWLIEYYHDEIIDGLNNERERIEKYGNNYALANNQQKIDKWNFVIRGRRLSPYKLLEDGEASMDGQIVADESFEYQIFNLVFIYNTFNWENDYLILNGW